LHTCAAASHIWLTQLVASVAATQWQKALHSSTVLAGLTYEDAVGRANPRMLQDKVGSGLTTRVQLGGSPVEVGEAVLLVGDEVGVVLEEVEDPIELASVGGR
jgi:hypothetical protein